MTAVAAQQMEGIGQLLLLPLLLREDEVLVARRRRQQEEEEEGLMLPPHKRLLFAQKSATRHGINKSSNAGKSDEMTI